MADYTGGSVEADHLCVLVHGLWGNPNHMASVAKSLRAKHSADKVYILVAKRNSGSFTYDGVETGGERVCLEIEEELRAIESRGGKITKLSVVGYSLGGLVARYAIGLLYAKGALDKLECMNFTAFASPFLGVRTPLHGWANHLWNVLGARTLSESGRQLFTIDKFRDTGRPLLAVLADPNSIFMKGLAKFQRRTLYTNIVNDRSAVYYTTGISKTDPYTDMSKIRVNYVKGYEDVILDPVTPVAPLPSTSWAKPTLRESAHKWFRRIPLIFALVVFVPVGVVAFLANSVFQTARSTKRIALHEKGQAGINPADYRGVPLLLTEIREAVEHTYETFNSSQNQEYLGSEDEEEPEASAGIVALERKQSHPHQPTLALAPYQFEMINALDSLGWRKYPVWIHKISHSHAAIIVRTERRASARARSS
ncbi:putative lipid particle protein [Phaeoacremonium minimum UCRPA7]|uniref:Putative lipid particle protein n=1 Tax=Phaeoacremonium minimum (strain UCR-PA7) TaxID=1286976 RepID=R8BCK6_PHAM7|nr:putative lipid particle protein [Phaeoacremonium minimum UCRPA7]EON97033.1 putative lipid particle protein [Phaeoacremonium minimum UCRPA7]